MQPILQFESNKLISNGSQFRGTCWTSPSIRGRRSEWPLPLPPQRRVSSLAPIIDALAPSELSYSVTAEPGLGREQKLKAVQAWQLYANEGATNVRCKDSVLYPLT